VWWSIFALSYPVVKQNTKYLLLSAASPCFVTFLLLYLSGIPLLEKAHEKKYGSNPEFINYKKNTNLLLPLPQGLNWFRGSGEESKEF